MDTQTRGRIEIYQTREGWMVDFTLSTSADMLRATLKTSILPTAYARAMPAAVVCMLVQEIYPSAAVHIREPRVCP